MGKKILILFMTLCATVVFSESNLKELIKTDDYHFIHVIMNHPSDSGLESSCSWYKFEYEYLDEQANYERTDVLKNYYKENDRLSKDDLLELFKTSEKFVIGQAYGKFWRYAKLYNGETPIGETFVRMYDGKRAPGFGYSVTFMDGDKVSDYTISCIFGNNGEEYMSSQPELFAKEDRWYWKNSDAPKTFFEMLLNHDKRLPKEFIEIQVLYEKILENLEVNGEKITVK